MDVVCLQAGCEARLARGSSSTLRSDLLDLLLTLLLHLLHLGSVLLSQVDYCAVHLLDLSLELALVLGYALAGGYSTSLAICFCWLLKRLWLAADDHGVRLLLLVPYALDGMQLLLGASDCGDCTAWSMLLGQGYQVGHLILLRGTFSVDGSSRCPCCAGSAGSLCSN